MKIKKQDNILIIAGKDKGKTGKVQSTIPSSGKVSVEGLNLYKRHIKPSKKNPQGGIIDISRAFPASNAMIICPHCSKPTRIGYKITEKGKIRLCQKCQESVDQE